ncbi:MAG: HD domain-containing protein [Eubacteriales bacterium]|nr:HD domain-containing protein [Eubacteriales bacterium]
MSRMRLVAQAAGTSVEGFCIVKSVQSKVNVKGSEYLDMILCDCEGEAVAKLWDYSPAVHGAFQPDDIIKIRATIVLWKDTEQLKIDKIRQRTAEDDVDLSLLVPCAPFDPDWMYEQLYETAEAFLEPDIRSITQYLLRTNKQALLLAPAAVKLHHATRGGLLHHTYSILQAAKALVPLYPELFPDLLYAGIILHDIAKLKEMETGDLGIAGSYTAAGQLIGHINMGAADIQSTAELLGITGDVPMLLEHMILSHHGVPEFGSPRPPMFPEAEVLSELDMLDARMYEMFDALSTVSPGGFSERQWALDNRQLYRHGLR